MIVKDREIPLELYRLEALNRRLHPQHKMKEKVQLDFKKARSGIRGEKEVDYPLRFLNEQDYLILHNLRLADQNGHFQIDTLLLNERYILLLEVKNWYGTILFGENGQVTRIGDNGVEEGFLNPIPQAKLQQHRLRKWLHLHDTSAIPIQFFVVISFPSTIIKSISPKHPIPENVIHNSQLFFKIEKLDDLYSTPKVKMYQLNNLAQKLIAAHTPPTINILEKYGISADKLMNGVICPECSVLPMMREHGGWSCQKCCRRSTNAHIAAFNDYKLLISHFISNLEVRRLLQIGSPNVAKYLLQKERFNKVGRTSKSVYELEFRF